MAQFLHYSCVLSEIERRARPRQIPNAVAEAHRQALIADPSLEGMSIKVLMDEEYWRRGGQRTIFVDSPDLPALAASIPVRNPESLVDLLGRWRGTWSFAFRAGTRVHDIPLGGCLFAWLCSADRVRRVRDYAREFGGHLAEPNDYSPPDAMHITGRTGKSVLHLSTPLHQLTAALSDPNWFAVNRFHDPFYRLDATPAEQDLQATLLRTVVGLILYAAAFPDALRPGLPDAGNKELGTKLVLAPHFRRSAVTLLGPTPTSAQRALHFRSGHFRILAHERYRRDEQGRVRVVYVRESLVGGKADAYTLEKQHDE